MTIDQMLSEVAKRIGAAPVKQPENVSEPEAIYIKSEKNVEKAPAQVLLKPALGLDMAKEIAYCVECAARQMKLAVVIAVANESGRTILLEAMDDSYIASLDAARDKAYTAVALKMPTHEALAQARGGALDGFTNGNGIMMLGGGFPLVYNGAVIGAVGVSGGTKEQDMMLAKAGVLYFCKKTEWQKGAEQIGR